jgi:hypothetical protein
LVLDPGASLNWSFFAAQGGSSVVGSGGGNNGRGVGWHHMGFTVDASDNWNFYTNGLLIASGTFSTHLASSTHFVIGTSFAGVTGAAAYEVKNVRWSNIARPVDYFRATAAYVDRLSY